MPLFPFALVLVYKFPNQSDFFIPTWLPVRVQQILSPHRGNRIAWLGAPF